MKTWLLVAASAAVFCFSSAEPVGAQTRVRPENSSQDPRLNALRGRLQSEHGSIRPLSTYLDVSGARPWGEERNFIYYTLEELLLEVGAEPVQSQSDAQFRLAMTSQSRYDEPANQVVETITLIMTDMRANGRQTIMRSHIVLECSHSTFVYHNTYICPIDRDVILESFLRLR